jgi:hypothetical protein
LCMHSLGSYSVMDFKVLILPRKMKKIRLDFHALI